MDILKIDSKLTAGLILDGFSMIDSPHRLSTDSNSFILSQCTLHRLFIDSQPTLVVLAQFTFPFQYLLSFSLSGNHCIIGIIAFSVGKALFVELLNALLLLSRK